MTRKELATQLYRLNIQRGICSNQGCGETEWVRRTLYGIGCCKPAKKQELEQAIVWAKEDLGIKE